jgi:hypothetical protein
MDGGVLGTPAKLYPKWKWSFEPIVIENPFVNPGPLTIDQIAKVILASNGASTKLTPFQRWREVTIRNVKSSVKSQLES